MIVVICIKQGKPDEVGVYDNEEEMCMTYIMNRKGLLAEKLYVSAQKDRYKFHVVEPDKDKCETDRYSEDGYYLYNTNKKSED